ncbi:ATP-dependent DNA helicase [Elysia marginata]|uniref:ATP-dependent DNA helicase n=1 Tax=Elysia marginata TaxID=1093978 RepID=A0AAV4EJY6_9GAST|nr:ATP-dependent DNA helicase [Elysia marginata]
MCTSVKKRYIYNRSKLGGARKEKKIDIIVDILCDQVKSPFTKKHIDHQNLKTIVDARPASARNVPRSHPSFNFKVLLLNVQSSRNKSTLLIDLIEQSNTDVAFFVETWLRPTGDEVTVSDLTPQTYTTVSFPRVNGTVGGISILHKKALNVTCNIFSFKTFECCECKITNKGHNPSFVCLYRPPPNTKNKITVKDFVAEFQNLLETYAIKKSRPIILGVFILQFDKSDNVDVISIQEVLTTYRLKQILSVPTHNKSHILDWVITEDEEIIKDLQVTGKCVSNNFVVSFQLDIQKPPRKKWTVVSGSKDIDHAKLSIDLSNKVKEIPID